MATETPDQVRVKQEKTLRAALPDRLHDMLEELVGGLEEEQRETKEKWQDGADEDAGTIAEAHETLTTVRYWLHDVLLLGKAPDRPRRLLQLVERALGHG